MTPPDCPPCPKPEEEITEEAIREADLYELKHLDRTLLAGPRSRLHDLSTVVRVGLDFIRAFRALHFAGPCVTIFGSARTEPGTSYYEMAREMGAALAELGFTVMTGGGPGIMQAGNHGAYEIGGRSIGVNIELPFEQELNPYVQRSVTMRYFFTRKVMLVKYSYAFIVMPGGAGTMDEMFETMTLIQTGQAEGFPDHPDGQGLLAAADGLRLPHGRGGHDQSGRSRVDLLHRRRRGRDRPSPAPRGAAVRPAPQAAPQTPRHPRREAA